jgi:hypothetical protein
MDLANDWAQRIRTGDVPSLVAHVRIALDSLHRFEGLTEQQARLRLAASLDYLCSARHSTGPEQARILVALGVLSLFGDEAKSPVPLSDSQTRVDRILLVRVVNAPRSLRESASWEFAHRVSVVRRHVRSEMLVEADRLASAAA